MINQIIKLVFALPIIIILLLTVILNVRLHTVSVNPKKDLVLELAGLKHSLDNHADTKMQNLYPEGYVFFNALYGLSWCNYLLYFNNADSAGIAHREIQRAVDNIYSENGRAVFSRDLPLPYGAFYVGWSTYLLGKKLSIEKSDAHAAAELHRFKQQCDAIAEALSINTFPVSYPGRTWPSDAVLCAASLALHDKLFEPKYQNIIQRWIERVEEHVDADGLIPHEVVPATGKIIEGARGSSQSLMLAFLHEIDDEFFRNQFNRYKEKFADSRLGLIGVREYPSGRYGLGDVDSGPVVLQMGHRQQLSGCIQSVMLVMQQPAKCIAK